MASKDKGKQVRMTLEDCLQYQDKLRDLLQQLIRENRALKHEEKSKYFELLPKSLLSQGSEDPVSFVIQGGWFTFASIQNMAHRMVDLHTDKVNMKTTRPEKVDVAISISELWQFLYDKVLYLFPKAQAEAIHISAESVERPQQGSYEFSSKDKLEQR
jgi:hypothetical protein